jgi:hypothetical protein
VYHGCVSNSGGLKLVLPGDHCKNNEVAVDWGQTGPQGPQGIQGVKGDRHQRTWVRLRQPEWDVGHDDPSS